ncbi:MAG: PSD1 and planctomycete cytochrome C domain-containing protein [Verrucomicrobiota bacterium]
MKHPVLIFLLAASLAHGAEAPVPAKIEFNRDVRPILSDNCYHCHGNDPAHRKAKLRLDVRGAALEKEAFVPGKPEDSQLIERILTDDADELMPPPDSHKQLSAAQKEILKRWIAEGAEYQPHWAFVAPKPVGLPAGLTGHPIDHYIQATLQTHGLTVSPAAEPATLIRRVSLDLTGLPPSPAEVDAFVLASTGNAEAAYRALVDQLLGSPHYGERWGRWWLDQARYADSNGYSIDAPRQIWKYRDWVIGALNADMPFDQFTIEQLAGDLLPEATVSQKVATGFHRNTQINEEGGIDKEQFRIDSVFDRVATTGTVWLGLTIGCAQCHDHKFDPIAQQEYYRLFAFFNNQDEPELKVMDPGVDAGALTAEMKDLEVRIKAWLEAHADALSKWEAGLTPEAIKSLPPQVRKSLAVPVAKRSLAQRRILGTAAEGGAGGFQEINDRYQEIDAKLNKGTTTLVMHERPQPRRTTVLIKGDFTRPAEEVTPGTPAVLHAFAKTNGPPNRLDLAKWIMSPDNPLTARVIMNRIWQQYFGRGLVVTENDFGLTSTPPSHPELLDWLATALVDRKWSLKEMHRIIVTSHTYRQSSSDTPQLREKDPNNYLLARQQRLRLDAEIVRDVALTASGLLSPRVGGPPVYPPIPDGVLNQGQSKRTWKESQGEDKFRRGLYTFVYRASPPPSLSVFDAPEGFTTCTRRIRSNTPLQALTLMNDSGFFEFATALEKIIQKDGLEAAFRRCTTRNPKPDELAVLEKLDTLNAARALLNLDETVTRE